MGEAFAKCRVAIQIWGRVGVVCRIGHREGVWLRGGVYKVSRGREREIAEVKFGVGECLEKAF